MKEIREQLFQLQDKDYKAFHSKLIPNISPERIIGVRTPALRSFAKELLREAKKDDAVQKQIDAFLSERIFSGAAKDAIFTDVLGDGTGWEAALKPATPRRTDGAWQLTLTKSGVEPVVLDVGDFATAADADDPGNAFSIWF